MHVYNIVEVNVGAKSVHVDVQCHKKSVLDWIISHVTWTSQDVVQHNRTKVKTWSLDPL